MSMALLKGFIYIVADRERRFAAVGMTRDFNARFLQLQEGCPLELDAIHAAPCRYARLREEIVLGLLHQEQIRKGWYRWDEGRIMGAVRQALAVPDAAMKHAAEKQAAQRPPAHARPVRRMDTGEVFPSAKIAAETVFGSKKFAAKIKKAISLGAKCGETFWENA